MRKLIIRCFSILEKGYSAFEYRFRFNCFIGSIPAYPLFLSATLARTLAILELFFGKKSKKGLIFVSALYDWTYRYLLLWFELDNNEQYNYNSGFGGFGARKKRSFWYLFSQNYSKKNLFSDYLKRLFPKKVIGFATWPDIRNVASGCRG